MGTDRRARCADGQGAAGRTPGGWPSCTRGKESRARRRAAASPPAGEGGGGGGAAPGSARRGTLTRERQGQSCHLLAGHPPPRLVPSANEGPLSRLGSRKERTTRPPRGILKAKAQGAHRPHTGRNGGSGPGDRAARGRHRPGRHLRGAGGAQLSGRGLGPRGQARGTADPPGRGSEGGTV